MRIFIALELSGDFLENLLEKIEPLKIKYPYLRWIPVSNFHITLAFLGETDAGLLPDIFNAVKNAAETPSIHAGAGKLFTLPRGRSPNVLAMGFNEGSAEITSLAKSTMNNLRKFNIFIEERSFIPHITLARKGRAGPEINKQDFINISFPVHGEFNQVAVFESKLSSHGADYIALEEFTLSGSG